MTDSIDNQALHEILRSIQAEIAIIREGAESVLGELHSDMAELSVRMDGIESRLSRVESRLNFGEQAQ